MADIIEILTKAVKMEASDIFLIAGLPVTYKVYGKQVREENRMLPDTLNVLVEQLYQQAGRENNIRINRMEDDFSFSLNGLARFRVNAFVQRNSLSAVIRILNFGIPTAQEAHIPESVLSVADMSKGLVLITGVTGSGKSTTMACILDKINNTYAKNIITMEDPIEFIHRHNKSIVIQREINTDSYSYVDALRASLRESPDVLFIGEMRDAETMQTAMTAGEVGKLVISSLHTMSASDTIDRIIDSFTANQQNQIRIQLSRVLNCIICQQLVNGIDGKQYPAFEIMKVTPAIRNLIREGKTYQIGNFIQEGKKDGMQSMNDSLEKMLKDGIIDQETALRYSDDVNMLKRHLGIR